MSKKRISVQIPTKESTSLGLSVSKKSTKKSKSKPEPESESEEDSQSDSSNNEGLSDLDEEDNSEEEEEDDEIDLDQEVSDDDEEDEPEQDSDSDSDLPKLKKRKKNTDDGSESFANAVTAILGSKLKAYDRKDPILARSKQTIKKAESEKLEAKARRELLADKKKVYDKDRIRDLLPKDDANARQIFDHERKLKKIAQRGVIRLFNVITSTQNKATSEADGVKVLGQEQKDKLITEISKEKFFDLVKQAGN
ncbi:hypothetical protein WICPIJ_008706 [Wickerhamomyces pijperi]|uniref:Rrp15p-domain-containing protein n=1 Tax=Wickerhamomyces pijperi TaxID=599730 RepID=A0A9P8TGV7_WICPI|nr:hypothetical protein WICPIJ_008706 [Wickerhamomyces pijperi]